MARYNKSFLSGYRFKTWHLVAAAAVLLVFLVGGSVARLIKMLFHGLNTAGKKLLGAVGLDAATNEVMNDALTGGKDNPWSPEYVKSRNPEYVSPGYVPTFALYESDIKACKSASGFWHAPRIDEWISIMHNFRTKTEFSYFCWAWEHYEGSNLAAWMLNGWFFGLVGSMGGTDFETLDSIIRKLPD